MVQLPFRSAKSNDQRKVQISRAQNFSSVSKIEILILDDVIGELGDSLATGVTGFFEIEVIT